MITLSQGTWLGQVPLVSRPSLGAGAQEISDAGFSQVLSAPKAIVDFWSPGCPHCVQFKPIYEAVAGQNPDILFAAVNVDQNVQNAGAYRVSGLPTVVFLQDGKEVHRVEGGMAQAEFMNEIAKAYSGGGTPLSTGGGLQPSPVTPRPLGLLVGALALTGIAGGVAYLLLKK